MTQEKCVKDRVSNTPKPKGQAEENELKKDDLEEITREVRCKPE